MGPKTIRVIAPLPPKGSVAARHAGKVICHLDAAGADVRPATSVGPAYSLDQLRFAPKAAYLEMRDRLLAEAPDLLVLYPEGLDFRVITQDRRWHRWLEKWRRLGLVWRLFWRARHVLVVFRPRLLKRQDHLAIVALASLAKLARPHRIRLVRQSIPAAKVVAPVLGHQPASCAEDAADMASLELAVKQGAQGDLRLTPVWLRGALGRLAAEDPLKEELAFLTDVVGAFGEAGLPVLANPAGRISAPPFADAPAPPVHGLVLSQFMLHLRQARRLTGRFPLDSRASTEDFRRWFFDEAPLAYTHALFRTPLDRAIDAEMNVESIAAALRDIYRNARFFGVAAQVSPALKAWLNTPLSTTLTRFEFLTAVLAHAPLGSPQDLQAPWQAKSLKPWFADRAFAGYPLLAELAELTPEPQPPVIQTTGYSATETGLGQNRKMSDAALRGLRPKRNIYLHHVNADAIPAQMLAHHQPGAFHIGYLLWELEAMPAAHALAGRVLDEVWTPTTYVQRIYENTFDCPVTCIGKGFDLPQAAPYDLRRLGVLEGQPVFLLSFDLHSSVARKNPLAAVHAFQMAFEGNPDARLLIKTSAPLKNHWGDPERQMSIIKKLMARDKRIILLQQHLAFADYLGLIQAVTALVSPHRAEGFGYVPAYAMKLGTPVIATDTSGTQDFCTPETALCVPWRKRRVRRGESIYPLENAFWAEIDHEALARAMQSVLSHPDTAQLRARNAQDLMARVYSADAQRARYKARLSDLGLIE